MNQKESVIEEKEFDLKLFVLKYLQYWYLFAIALIVALGAAWFINWYAAPVYRISGKLLIKDESMTPERALLRDLDISSKGKNMENEIEILRSHRMISQALSQLDFEVSYYLIGNIKTSEVYKNSAFRVEIDTLNDLAYFFPFSVTIKDDQTFEWKYKIKDESVTLTGRFGEPFHFPLGTVTLNFRDDFDPSVLRNKHFDKRNYQLRIHGKDRMRNVYVNRLAVMPISGQSTIVELVLHEEVPQKGKDFINTLVSVYLQNDVNEKNRTADHTAVFIDQQLEKISEDLRTIESTREKFKAGKGIIDLSAESQVVLNQARSIDEKLAANNARKSIISHLRDYVANEDLGREMAPTTIDVNDILLNDLIKQLYELEAERQQLEVGGTVKHHRFGSLNAEIDRTRAKIVENIENIEKTIDLANAELEHELARVRSRIQEIPTTERELIGIERQYRIQESLYLYLLEKQAEVSISLASSVSDNRIVDMARSSVGAVKPVKSRAYSIALLIALVIPVGFIYLREQLDDFVRDTDIISTLANGIPVIGLVGLSKSGSNLVIRDKPNSLIAEAYRSVRTNLKFFGLNEENKVLLITSSIGTEGKTFTAMNLSSVLALSGKKTILLGLDLRKPKIIKDFNLHNERGISTFLSSEHNLDDIIQSSGLIKDFDIIPSGPVPPNPSELIMSQRMDELIQQLSIRYDHIIIDSPPVGLVTDGLILMKYAALSIFVIRQNVTRKHHLRHLKQMFDQQKLGQVAILFNAVKKNRGTSGYGYGYHYGYGYGYTEDGYGYYTQGEEPQGWFSRVKRIFLRF